MTDLATTVDVEARLGRTLTDTEALRIDALLADASASIRNYTRQELTAVAGDIATFKVRNGRVKLPQRPVTDVIAVTSLNSDPVLYQWLGDDTILTGTNTPDSFAWVPWTSGIPAVNVEYDHGYDLIPDDIIGVCCSIVTRALGREPVDAGITSEAIAGYSYSLGSAAAAGGFGMLQAEKDILDAYKRVGGSVNISPRVIVP